MFHEIMWVKVFLRVIGLLRNLHIKIHVSWQEFLDIASEYSTATNLSEAHLENTC